jgi:serine phosphatase RsbU (regulator of sigma subunit)
MFGEARLREAFAAAPAGTAETPDALVARITEDVARFAAGAPAEDDLTLLALRYTAVRCS